MHYWQSILHLDTVSQSMQAINSCHKQITRGKITCCPFPLNDGVSSNNAQLSAMLSLQRVGRTRISFEQMHSFGIQQLKTGQQMPCKWLLTLAQFITKEISKMSQLRQVCFRKQNQSKSRNHSDRSHVRPILNHASQNP